MIIDYVFGKVGVLDDPYFLKFGFHLKVVFLELRPKIERCNKYIVFV